MAQWLKHCAHHIIVARMQLNLMTKLVDVAIGAQHTPTDETYSISWLVDFDGQILIACFRKRDRGKKFRIKSCIHLKWMHVLVHWSSSHGKKLEQLVKNEWIFKVCSFFLSVLCCYLGSRWAYVVDVLPALSCDFLRGLQRWMSFRPFVSVTNTFHVYFSLHLAWCSYMNSFH